MKHWKVWLILVGMAGLGIYAADFYFERWIHYKLSYQSLVQSEIRRMVKPECLKE
jgi:hypothetical protein